MANLLCYAVVLFFCWPILFYSVPFYSIILCWLILLFSILVNSSMLCCCPVLLLLFNSIQFNSIILLFHSILFNSNLLCWFIMLFSILTISAMLCRCPVLLLFSSILFSRFLLWYLLVSVCMCVARQMTLFLGLPVHLIINFNKQHLFVHACSS